MTHNEQLLIDIKAMRSFLSAQERWQKGSMYRAEWDGLDPKIKAACLLGAINIACGARAELAKVSMDLLKVRSYLHMAGCDGKRAEELRRLIASEIAPDDFGGVIEGWNDHPNRTHGELLAMLDRCIERAELRCIHERIEARADALVERVQATSKKSVVEADDAFALVAV
jgi:hypothetical protein